MTYGLFSGGYTAADVDLRQIRQALAALRKAAWPNSRVAAKAVGLGASTVAKLENVKTYPDYDPGVGVILRLIEGLPEPQTLSEFFLQIERQTDGNLPASAGAGRTALPLEGNAKDGRQRRAVPVEASSLLAAGDALVEAGGRLIAAASGIEIGKRARSTDSVRRSKPAKGARHTANR